jgi:hypothetical protein
MMRHFKRWFAVSTAASLLFMAACGTRPPATKVSATAPARAAAIADSQSISPTSLILMSLPAGFGIPSELAGDPQAPGVWFFVSDSEETRLLHYLPGAAPATWSLGPSATNGLAAGVEAGIAVVPPNVWVGANSTLDRLNSLTGAVTRINLSPVALASGQQYGPPEVTTLQNIRALAADGTGHLAVAQNRSSAVQLLDTSSLTFTPVTLPSGTEPNDVAFDAASHTLAVALHDLRTQQDDALFLRRPNGSTSEVQTGSYFVQADPSGFGAGGSQVSQVTPDGAQKPFAVPPPPMSVAGGIPAFAPDGRIVQPTLDGLEVFDPQTGKHWTLKLPSFDCGGASAMATARPQPAPTSVSCTQRVTELTTDNESNIWFTASGPAQNLYELPAASLS